MRVIDLFQHYPIADTIFDVCCHCTLQTLRMLHSDFASAVHRYMTKTYNFTRFLSFFFADATRFRRVMRTTLSVIGSISALRFVTRQRFISRTLHVFVAGMENTQELCRHLRGEGYVFTPSRWQTRFRRLEDVIQHHFERDRLGQGGDRWGVFLLEGYRFLDSSRLSEHRRRPIVFNFVRATEGSDPFKIKVTSGSSSVAELLLSMNKSKRHLVKTLIIAHIFEAAVMNVCTHVAAYALFPRTTLCVSGVAECLAPAISIKMDTSLDRVLRSIISPCRPIDLASAPREMAQGPRRIGDDLTWVFRFGDSNDLEEGINDTATTRPQFDPITLNSFTVSWPTQARCVIQFDVLRMPEIASLLRIRRPLEMCYTSSRKLTHMILNRRHANRSRTCILRVIMDCPDLRELRCECSETEDHYSTFPFFHHNRSCMYY